MEYTTRNYSDLRKNKRFTRHTELLAYIDNKMNLRLDSPPFDLLYTNIKARANSSMSKLPPHPRWGPATHRLNVIDIFCSKIFPVDFTLRDKCFLVNFVLAIATKHDQIHPHRGAISRRDEDEIGRRSNRRILLLPQRWNRR
jgi:hypothetical protein